MRRWMRGLVLFGAGLVLGMVTIKSIEAQQEKRLGLQVEHVGIAVKNLQESVDYYTKTLGMRSAFVFGNRDGNPGINVIQVNKDTFLELSQATADRPVGLNHLGLETKNMNETEAELKKRGVAISEISTANTDAPHSFFTDPNGVRIEVIEIAPNSLQRKAIDSY